MADQLKIVQVKSGAGMPREQRRTLRALGLKHHQDEVVQVDSPAIRGMIRKVSHLVDVQQVEA